MFTELRKYHKQHGHCQVNINCSANAKLGRWVKRQRQAYKLALKGENSTLTSKRIAALHSVDFIKNVSGKGIPSCDINRCSTKEVPSNEIIIRNISTFHSSHFHSPGECSSLSDKGYSDEESSNNQISLSTDEDDSNSISPDEEVASSGVIIHNMNKLNSLMPDGVSSSHLTKEISDDDSSMNQVSLSSASDENSMLGNKLSIEYNSKCLYTKEKVPETIQSISSNDASLTNTIIQDTNTYRSNYCTEEESGVYIIGKTMWRCDCCYKAYFRTEKDAWEHAVLCAKQKSSSSPDTVRS